MPPELTRITGRAQVTRFFATVPADGRLVFLLLRTTTFPHLNAARLAVWLSAALAACLAGFAVALGTGRRRASPAGQRWSSHSRAASRSRLCCSRWRVAWPMVPSS